MYLNITKYTLDTFSDRIESEFTRKKLILVSTLKNGNIFIFQ